MRTDQTPVAASHAAIPRKWATSKEIIMQAIDYITLEEQYGAHNYHPLDVVLAKGQGIWVSGVLYRLE